MSTNLRFPKQLLLIYQIRFFYAVWLDTSSPARRRATIVKRARHSQQGSISQSQSTASRFAIWVVRLWLICLVRCLAQVGLPCFDYVADACGARPLVSMT